MPDESDPLKVWTDLRTALLCRCGDTYASIEQIPAINTAYTVFQSSYSSNVFIDPDTKASIRTTKEFKKLTDNFTQGNLDIAAVNHPRLLVAWDKVLKLVTLQEARNTVFHCHKNECVNRLTEAFKEISVQEKLLMEQYKAIQNIKLNNIVHTTTPPEIQSVQPETSVNRVKRNFFDLFFEPSATQVQNQVIIGS